MICVQCAQEVAAGAKRCLRCDRDPLLDGRYRLDRRLASDAIGHSYRATRVEDGLLVRARGCALAATPEDLASLLVELEHRTLPRLLEHFVCNASEDQTHEGQTRWLIHEHLRGQTLSERLAITAEGRLDQRRVLRLLDELAATIAELHARSPAIVHGGIRLDTVVLRAPDDHACLLDLGGSSDALAAGDIRALGALALLALGGASLEELAEGGTPPAWRERVVVDDGFAVILESMLERDPDRRVGAGALTRALAALRARFAEAPARRPSNASLPQPWTRPSGSSRRGGQHQAQFVEPRPVAPGTPLSSARRVRASTQDVPLMRPEELSRELSQAHHAATSLAQQQRASLAVARVLVVIVAAVIAGLATYVALMLGR